MQEEPADKLLSTDCKLFFCIAVAAIAIPEPYRTIIKSNDPVVGDRHPGKTQQGLADSDFQD